MKKFIMDESYWSRIRESFSLDPNEIYLNTGSFGSLPRSVFESMQEVLHHIEKNPTRHRGQQQAKVTNARKTLAAFLNAPAEDIAFTSNVTMAINMVVLGLDWQSGDEILASDQEYGAIDNCLHLAETRFGIVVKRTRIPIPPAGPEEVLDAFEAEFTPRTKLVLCSHITTRTGLINPLDKLVDLAHQHGALIAFDGAHAPGMIPLDLQASGCDFYGGNCHKWLCAPKGTGFLFAKPDVQDRMRHVVASWGYSQEGPSLGDKGELLINDQPFMWGLENWGTRDQACFIAVADAVDFQVNIGKDQILARGRQLADHLRQKMSQTGWANLLTPSCEEMSGSISAFELLGFQNTDLYDTYKITVPFGRWEDKDSHWMRVSTHICNGFEQIDTLIEALTELRGKIRRPH
ncbi:MAG: aminotransferase class V-fold PLP-dependent enzyme [Candidatus Latescibacteria bacterium]|nr:aminotransferase class V-fold PLP-dependent enzyme [Candidatus Latescibacterota bacterium]